VNAILIFSAILLVTPGQAIIKRELH